MDEITLEVTRRVEDLYKFRNTFISKHGIEKASEKSLRVQQELDHVLKWLENVEPNCHKTFYLLQKGKALNILTEYNKECEECLSAVIKRDPSLWEGWNMLGETYWKRGDMAAAKDCFESSLQRQKNKVALRSLSMVMRQLKPVKADDLSVNVMNSVKEAKEAVDLDKNDGMSWYILGNAYLSLFFCTNQDSKILSQALDAYSEANSVDENAKFNPDLHFNRAQAHRYQEVYSQAFDELKQAALLDPEWKEPQNKIHDLKSYLIKVNELTSKKGKLKAKKLQQFAKTLSTSKLLGIYNNASYKSESGEQITLKSCPLKDLTSGKNEGKVIVGRVVCSYTDVAAVPFTFSMIDSTSTCLVVTVYNLAQGRGMIIGDSVAIPEPNLVQVNINIESNNSMIGCKFPSIRVDAPTVLVVNSRLLTPDNCASTTASMDVLQGNK